MTTTLATRATSDGLEGLSARMAKGAAWTVLFRLSDRCIGFVSTLILARVLAPEDFGLIAMATAILAVLELISTFSFDLALIQNTGAARRHYDTAWTFEVIFGAANAIALVALAIPAASFYAEPRVAPVMLVLALTVLLRGFTNIGIVAFQKELQFHKEFNLGLGKKLVGFFVTVVLAYLLRTYWALLAGQFASAAAGVVLSYLMHPYRPRFSLRGRKELFNFSKWLLMNNILIGLSHRAADFVVGRLSGPHPLGLYTVAYEIANLPTTDLVAPISRAVFPGYAIMAKRLEDLRRGFLDVLSLVLIVVLPAGVGIIVLAEPFVQVLLGSKWTATVPLIQVLGVFGVLRASASNMGSVYLAVGRPRLLTNLAILYLAILLPSLIWLVPQRGAFGAAFAVMLSASIQVPIGYAVLMRTIRLRASAMIAVMWRPVLAALIMGLVIHVAHLRWFSSEGIEQSRILLQLMTLVTLGAALYIAVLSALWILSAKPRGGETIMLTGVEKFLGQRRKKLQASG